MFKLFRKKADNTIPKPQPKKLTRLEKNTRLLYQLDAAANITNYKDYYPAPQLPKGVYPESHDIMAMDGFCTASNYSGGDAQFYSDFLPYPVLAELSQSPEYQLVADTMSQEMTREWGEVKGEDAKRVELLNDAMRDLDIRATIRQAIKNDFLMGGCQIYIDIAGHEKKTDLPLMIDERGIKKDSLRGFIAREPIWSTPSMYNATDALAYDYFKPKKWWVLGQEVDASRLMTLVMRPVTDMLKPAYNFYGISMTQEMLPYVQRLQSINDSVARLITMFSMTGIKTDLSALLAADEHGVSTMLARGKAITLGRKNDSIIYVDKENEEFFQINTPVTGLDVLITSFQHQMAIPSKIPVIKLFGTPTAGLGNTSDGEIRVFYDNVAAQQESFILPIIRKMLDCMQLSMFGNIDKTIEFRFNPLYQLDDNERADVNMKKATTAQILIQEGVIDNNEARQALTDDENSGYTLEGDAPERDYYEGVVDDV